MQITAGKQVNDSVKFSVARHSSNQIHYHLFARHKDVVEILGPSFSEKVNLSHYDNALKSGAGGAEFFISGYDKKDQWALLKDAMSQLHYFDRNIPEIGNDIESSQCPNQIIEGFVTEAVDEAIEIILNHKTSKSVGTKAINPVNDYGYLVTYLLVEKVVGFKMPDRRSWFYWPFKLISRLRKQPQAQLRAQEIRKANELILWIEIMFAHLFINPGSHNKAYLIASKLVSKRYKNEIRRSMLNPKAGSLIERMQKVRGKQRVSDAQFEKLCINIVMELVGSFQYLTGQAFAGVYRTIHTKFSDQLDSEANPISNFNELMQENSRAMIDEAMRHNSPTGFILRTASKDFTYNNIDIARNDILCVLCDEAVKDPDVFSDPEEFYDIDKANAHQDNYLAFASPDLSPSKFQPKEAHHPCFGQYWARLILERMLVGLEGLQEKIWNSH